MQQRLGAGDANDLAIGGRLSRPEMQSVIRAFAPEAVALRGAALDAAFDDAIDSMPFAGRRPRRTQSRTQTHR